MHGFFHTMTDQTIALCEATLIASQGLLIMEWKKFMCVSVWLLAMWLPLTSDAATITNSPPCMPYIGEQFSFDVSWEFINAGSATMNISAKDQGWQVKTLARTNKFLDVFRKVRDTITAEGLCVNGHMQSTIFNADLKERKYSAKKYARFLWKKNQVSYTQHENVELFDVPAGHLSVIDAFLAVRQLELKAGQTLSIPIFDSRKRYEILVNVMEKKQRLKAPWGEKVNCILIKPKLKTAGIFASKGEMTVWMTDDKRHIPIRVRAKIKFGRIFADLTGYSKSGPIVASAAN